MLAASLSRMKRVRGSAVVRKSGPEAGRIRPARCGERGLCQRLVRGKPPAEMFTLRCTAKLLKQLRVPPQPATEECSTRLGDWYANILWGRPRVILCVSERTLLPLLVAAPKLGLLIPALRDSVGEMLRRLGVPDAAIAEEQAAMAAASVDRTANRRVLGTMNDFAFLVDVRKRNPGSLMDLAYELSKTPCGPLKMESPGASDCAALRQSGSSSVATGKRDRTRVHEADG